LSTYADRFYAAQVERECSSVVRKRFIALSRWLAVAVGEGGVVLLSRGVAMLERSLSREVRDTGRIDRVFMVSSLHCGKDWMGREEHTIPRRWELIKATAMPESAGGIFFY